MRAPIPYYGGKQYMYKKIIALFPPHQTYVEPFGGAASVLLNKEPSPVEVYNDIDGDVVNLFRVLRDQGDKLQRQLQLTPYARGEFVDCLENHCEEPVERARRTFVRFRQGFSGKGGASGSWSYTLIPAANAPRKFRSAVDVVLPQVIDRFKAVQIECLDFNDIVPRYDSPDTLFYCDPPYLWSARKTNSVYAHEMTNDQHYRLLKLLQSVEGMAVLSGYHNKLYDKVLTDWQYHELDVTVYASGMARTRECKGGRVPRRTEVVWLNPAAVARREERSLL